MEPQVRPGEAWGQAAAPPGVPHVLRVVTQTRVSTHVSAGRTWAPVWGDARLSSGLKGLAPSWALSLPRAQAADPKALVL